MGLFSRHKLFISYFLLFILVSMRDNVRWSICIMLIFIAFPSLVTSQWPFLKRQLDQNSMSRLSGMDHIEAWGKRMLLACSRDAGGWYKLLQIIENLSSYTSRFICDLLGMSAVKRSWPWPLAGRLFHCLCLRGTCYPEKDASGASGTIEQSIRRARGQARVWILLYNLHHRIMLSYEPRIVIRHIKKIDI